MAEIDKRVNELTGGITSEAAYQGINGSTYE